MIRIGIVGHIARREMAAQAIVNCANNHRGVLNELYAMPRGEGWCIALVT